MAAPFGHPGDHRQHRRCPFQRLDLRLLVGHEDRRVRRRGQVQAGHVADLVNQQRIGGDLELLHPVRLQAEGPPDTVHGRRGDPHPPGQLPLGPVRGPLGHLLQGAHHHLFHLGAGDSARHPGPGLIAQAIQPPGQEPGPPLPDGGPADAQPRGHRNVRPAIRAGQHDPGPQRQPLRGLAPLRPVLQRPPLGPGQHQRLKPRVSHATSRPRAKRHVTIRQESEMKCDSRGGKGTQVRDASEKRHSAPKTGHAVATMAPCARCQAGQNVHRGPFGMKRF